MGLTRLARVLMDTCSWVASTLCIYIVERVLGAAPTTSTRWCRTHSDASDRTLISSRTLSGGTNRNPAGLKVCVGEDPDSEVAALALRWHRLAHACVLQARMCGAPFQPAPCVSSQLSALEKSGW